MSKPQTLAWVVIWLAISAFWGVTSFLIWRTF